MGSMVARKVGRPRKYRGRVGQLSVIVLHELRDYLASLNPTLTQGIIECLQFSKDIDDGLKDVLLQLRLSAAHAGLDYSEARAKTLTRLVKLGLEAEGLASKKSTK